MPGVDHTSTSAKESKASFLKEEAKESRFQTLDQSSDTRVFIKVERRVIGPPRILQIHSFAEATLLVNSCISEPVRTLQQRSCATGISRGKDSRKVASRRGGKES